MNLRGCVFVLGTLLLVLALPAAWAEVITRVDPDGRVRHTVVHGVPSDLDTHERKYLPSPAGIAAAKEQVRTGTAPTITMQRHGLWGVR